MPFVIAACIIGVACAAISAKILLGYNHFSLWLKIPATLLIFTAWFAPVILHWIRRRNLIEDMALFNGLSHFMYYLFGLAFVIFGFLMIRDIAWFTVYSITKLAHQAPEWLHPQNETSLLVSNICVLIVSFFLSVWGVWQAVKIPDVKEINLSSRKIISPLKIVMLSDLHINVTSSKDRLQKIINKVNSLRPDVVVLTGDVIDDRIKNVRQKINLLTQINAPEGVYSVLGNHDLWTGIPFWYVAFNKMGLHPLLNDGKRLDKYGIFIAGLPDLGIASASPLFRFNFERAQKDAKENDYKILLSHSPKINLEGNKFDLQLSGHTHGGQIFPFHLLAKYSNKYLAGLYSDGDMNIYVSRGAGYWGPPMRIFAPAEITLINLLPEK